ncbi:MAG: O-phosphoserine--tRNA ligase [Chloroflexi bacterium CG07_land_8_20_14_0_80_45_17]|nr:MAG: O-phosphoserine--tRNA ligase [Chloroflexi bacterium CG07_land_8_20_14_0_80_45_17]
MATFDLNEIKAQAKKNFTEAWVSTGKLIPKGTKISLERKGKPHLVRQLVQQSREILLNLGFDEVENLTILPDYDVSKQYGPEARVILDRVFYLAELPRPEIGLSASKITQVKKIAAEVDIEKLRSILRRYKKGEIEADNLIEELIAGLDITDYQATELLNRVFPELRKLRPLPSNKTLRSHMTATWFHTLAALQGKAEFPLALFSVGPRYRNEQREDAHHLRVHHSASVVVMAPEMSLDAGREITRDIIRQYGFSDIKFETKTATSKYYAPGQEQEAFINYKGDWLEVADIGMYSPISLANFDIRYPVFNAGLGIERLAMILYEVDDMRKLAYPQFSVAEYSDEDIAGAITYITNPKTARGKKIAKAIEETAQKYKDEIAPCEFLAWVDDSIQVKVVETEAGKRLIGPAGFNEICVANGSIYSDVVPSGVYTGINYMRAIAMGAAALIESGDESLTYQVKTIKHLSDLNLRIPEAIRGCIEGQQKKIGVGGAVFVTIKSQVLKRKTS